MNELNLVKKAIHGDNEAFETLILSIQEQLYRTAYLYMQNKNDALDILQETAYLGMKSIHQLKKPAYFKTWITRILINAALKELKHKQKLLFSENYTILEASSAFQSSDLDLAAALKLLREDYQIVIFLHTSVA